MAKQSGAISRPLGACMVQSGYRCPREEGQGVELASLTSCPTLPGESPGLHVTKESESSQSRHGVDSSHGFLFQDTLFLLDLVQPQSSVPAGGRYTYPLSRGMLSPLRNMLYLLFLTPYRWCHCFEPFLALGLCSWQSLWRTLRTPPCMITDGSESLLLGKFRFLPLCTVPQDGCAR